LAGLRRKKVNSSGLGWAGLLREKRGEVEGSWAEREKRRRPN
jgi:hypothetical protein